MIPFRTSAPSSDSVTVTMGLIFVNIAVFLYQIGLSGGPATRFLYTYALVPVVFSRPEVAAHAGLDSGNVLPFLTNTFMHGGYLHLIFNMWTLWLFGGPLEGVMGRLRYLGFYLGCGIAGSVGHFVFNALSPIPALGASGAIAGVLGGYLVTFPRSKVFVVQPVFILPVVLPLPAFIFAIIWFAVQVIGGAKEFGGDGDHALGGGIAWWAHIIGFTAGFAAAWIGRRRPGNGPWMKIP